MKLKDYFPIGSCFICGRILYTPIPWTGRRKDGTRTEAPIYATCLHKELLKKQFKTEIN